MVPPPSLLASHPSGGWKEIGPRSCCLPAYFHLPRNPGPHRQGETAGAQGHEEGQGKLFSARPFQDEVQAVSLHVGVRKEGSMLAKCMGMLSREGAPRW